MDAAILDKHLLDISEAAERVQHIVHQASILASKNNELPIQPEVCTLPAIERHVSTICESAVRSARRQLHLRKLAQSDPAGSVWEISIEHFRLVLQSLADNAVKYSPTGSNIGVACGVADGDLRVSIENRTTAAQGASVKRFLELGWRHPESFATTSGAGIGLTVAQLTCRANGWSLTLSAQPSHGNDAFAMIKAGLVIRGTRR